MISQYSDPRDIDREFWNDKAKALYWLKKHTSRRAVEWRLMEDGYDVMDGKAEYRLRRATVGCCISRPERTRTAT